MIFAPSITFFEKSRAVMSSWRRDGLLRAGGRQRGRGRGAGALAGVVSPLITAALLLGGMSDAQGQAKGGRESLLNKEGVAGLWLMGQSLCEGSESLPVVTGQDTGWGNLSFKRGVRTWRQADHGAEPERRAVGDFNFVPLRAVADGGLGETMANGIADHLTAAACGFDKTRTNGMRQQFLVAYAGQGGRTIEELAVADLSTDSRTPTVKQGGGGYYKTSLDDARRAVAQAKAAGRPFHIAALVWMQGEGNGGAKGGLMPTRWGEELPRAEGQAWYRDRLMAYRRQWSDDLRKITGQAGEIPMFTYQTLGPAGEAQLMAADADAQITLVGPHYMVPSAINSQRAGGVHGAAIHLAADGERWYGEQVGKVVRRVLVEGEDWQPLRPRKAWVEAGGMSVRVDFHVPRPPLVLDEDFMPRQQVEMTAKVFSSLGGFRIKDEAGGGVGLTAVEVVPPAQLRIRLEKPLKAGARHVLSCGHPQAGRLGKIASIRQGPATERTPTTELLVAGVPEEVLARLLDEGAFYVANEPGGAPYAQAPVRAAMAEAGTTTVLRFEDRELRDGVAFAVGQELRAMRPFAYSNLRDSDTEQAVFDFADEGYGRRAGKPYPLWNWCVLFEGFLIEEG